MDPIVLTGLVAVAVLLLLSWRRIHRAPRVEIGERGILDRSLGLGWIRWDEIEGAYQRRAQEQDSIFLRLRPSERIRSKLRKRARGEAKRGGESFDVRIDLSGTHVSAVELLQEILAHDPGGPTPAAR